MTPRGKFAISTTFAIALASGIPASAFFQSAPRQIEQQRQAQQQQRHLQAEQSESIERVQREIAHAQAEQQRESQAQADGQRRADMDVGRKIEAQQRDEQRRALILQQHQAAEEIPQRSQQTTQNDKVQIETAAQENATVPTSADQFHPMLSPFAFHTIGIFLLATALLLALGSWVRDRFAK